MAQSFVSISDFTSIENNNDWLCSICTYQNQNNSSQCELCLTPRINKSIQIPNKSSNISVPHVSTLSQSLVSIELKHLVACEQDVMDDILKDMKRSKPKTSKKKHKRSFFHKKRNKSRNCTSDLTLISKKRQKKKHRNLSNSFYRHKNRNKREPTNNQISLTKSKNHKNRLSLQKRLSKHGKKLSKPTTILTSISAPVISTQNRSISNNSLSNLVPQSVTSLVTTSSWNTTDNNSDSSDIESMYDTAVNVHNETPMGNISHKETPMGNSVQSTNSSNELKIWFDEKVKIPHSNDIYYKLFLENGYETLSIVKLLTEDKLKAIGIWKQGHIDKIMFEINNIGYHIQNDTEGIITFNETFMEGI